MPINLCVYIINYGTYPVPIARRIPFTILQYYHRRRYYYYYYYYYEYFHCFFWACPVNLSNEQRCVCVCASAMCSKFNKFIISSLTVGRIRNIAMQRN